MPRCNPSHLQAMKEWQEIQTQFQPPDDFRMKVSGVLWTETGTATMPVVAVNSGVLHGAIPC